MSLGCEFPAYWYGIPEEERNQRVLCDGELCVIDGQHFFIKGRLRIPLMDCSTPFEYLVWVSLSEANFKRTIHLWEQPGREAEPAYFGWLSNLLPGYPSTLNLKAAVHTRPVGERPTIELEPTDHPLAQEQLGGVGLARVQQIGEQSLHR